MNSRDANRVGGVLIVVRLTRPLILVVIVEIVEVCKAIIMVIIIIIIIPISITTNQWKRQ